MTKKDYEAAARIVQRWASVATTSDERDTVMALESAFSELFAGDNYRFDAQRFHRACVPGANVKARS